MGESFMGVGVVDQRVDESLWLWIFLMLMENEGDSAVLL